MMSFLVSGGIFMWVLVSILLGLTANSLFMVWVALEINMLSFLTHMIIFKTGSLKATPMKYFLIQSVGSAFLMGAVIYYYKSPSMMMSAWVLLSMSLKLGAAPFHSWFIEAVGAMSWEVLLMLATLQKVLPLVIMSSVYSKGVWGVVLSCLIMSPMGIVGTYHLKKFLGYSSIFSLAWMMMACVELPLMFLYLSAYLMALAVLVSVFSGSQLNSLSEMSLSALPLMSGLSLFSGLFSMAGFPPFLGFLVKAMIVQLSMELGAGLISGALVVGSIYFLYLYTTLILTNLLWKSGWKLNPPIKVSGVFSVMVLWGVAGMVVYCYMYKCVAQSGLSS